METVRDNPHPHQPDAPNPPSPLVRAALRLTALVPPGRSLVGAYPLEPFLAKAVRTSQHPGLFVFIDCQQRPCDGSLYRPNERLQAIALGQLVVFDVLNETPELQQLVLRVWGVKLPPDVSGATLAREDDVAHQIIQGQLAPSEPLCSDRAAEDDGCPLD